MIFFPTTISVRSSTYIQIGFNADVGDLSIDNFFISADRNPADILEVYSVEVRGRVVDITCSPAFPLVSYTIELRDGAVAFSSLVGDLLSEDSGNSRLQFVGPEEANEVRDRMQNSLPSIYDAGDNNALHAHVSSLAREIFAAQTSVRQTSNASYIEEIAADTAIIRSEDSSDRLPQESAFQIDRIGQSPAGATAERGNFVFEVSDRTNPLWDTFPSAPYLLRQRTITEVVSNIETVQNSFSGLTLSLAQPNVIAVLNLSLTQLGTEYTYDITQYPVLLASNRYDPNFAAVNSRLGSNQVQIPQSAVQDLHIPVPTSSDSWTITYAYDDTGIRALQDPAIYSINTSTRELAPAQINVFSLDHRLVCDQSGTVVDSGGVSFLYPAATALSTAYNSTHPAFRVEVEYNRLAPPSKPGQYAVDYTSGQVLVFGETAEGLGTGTIPPAMNYIYRREYQAGVDFVLDPEEDEIVAVVGRGLVGQEVSLDFKYEAVYRPDVDYVAEVHNEVVNEYIGNNIIGNNKIRTEHFPITDVFTITNETTGEEYRAAAFSHNEVTIAGDVLPKRAVIRGEPANFLSISQETLLVGDTIINDANPVVRAVLANQLILSSVGGYIGSSVDTSLVLDADLFLREWFFDSSATVLANTSKLTTVGDYCVDYSAGYIYVKILAGTGPGLGDAAYRFGTISVGNPHVTSVDALRYAQNGGSSSLYEIDSTFTADTITPFELNSSVELYLPEKDMPLILGSIASGIAGYWRTAEDVFYASDAFFDSSVEDGYHYLRLEDDNDRLIVEFINAVSVRVDLAFSDNGQDAGWQLYQANQTTNFTIATNYPAKFVKGIYLTSDLVNSPPELLTNLWVPETDSFQDYVVTSQNTVLDGYAAGTSLAVVYDYGSVFADYERLVDTVRISYEWGDNSVRWKNSPPVGQTYFVSYRYGALRRELKENFASMLGLQDLVDADMEFPRESIRDLTKAAYRIFAGGPTYNSVVTLGEIPTLIKPDVQELSFDEWTLGRDHLCGAAAAVVGDSSWELGRWATGLSADTSYITIPNDNIVSYRSGAFSMRVQNRWFGINNNAEITIDVDVPVENIWIGPSGYHPTDIPFSISANEVFPYETTGRPSQFWNRQGLHVWFDQEDLLFKIAAVGTSGSQFIGTVTTNGKFAYRQDGYIDGYGLEVTDQTTTTQDQIDFSFVVDGYDLVSLSDGYLDVNDAFVNESIYADIIGFVASKPNYFFDTGLADGGRLSLYKDVSGFLVLAAVDDNGADRWSVSANIGNWIPGEDHTIGASWRFNSPTAQDSLHLFIDGREASNLIRWGGYDPGTSTFRSTAVEVVDPSLSSPIIYGSTGVTTAGSNTISDIGVDFVALGVQIGDQLTVLENTNDGLGSPYTISAVYDGYLEISSSLTLSLDLVEYSINQMTYALDTNLDAAFVIYADGVELPGPDAEVPAYSVERVNGLNYLTLWGDVAAGSEITAETRGLTLSRARFTVTRY